VFGRGQVIVVGVELLVFVFGDELLVVLDAAL
jgi:hypothetical protein